MTADQSPEDAVTAWNEAHPIGTPVTAWPGVRGPGGAMIGTRTRSHAWLVGRQPVVAVEGYPGGIALTHVELRTEATPITDQTAELERLRRWKAEALEVISGLQDLGHALGIRPGERITGPAACEAAATLRHAATAAGARNRAALALLDEIGAGRSDFPAMRSLDYRLREALTTDPELPRATARNPERDEETGA